MSIIFFYCEKLGVRRFADSRWIWKLFWSQLCLRSIKRWGGPSEAVQKYRKFGLSFEKALYTVDQLVLGHPSFSFYSIYYKTQQNIENWTKSLRFRLITFFKDSVVSRHADFELFWLDWFWRPSSSTPFIVAVPSFPVSPFFDLCPLPFPICSLYNCTWLI